MKDCASTDSLHDYDYDYYNFYPSIKSFYSDFSMDAALRAELSGLIVKDVDMEEYVQHVYGVSKADIEYMRSKEWKIEGLSTYTKLLDEDAKEEDLYESCKTMMDGLFSTLTDDGLKLDVHYVSLGKTTMKSIGKVRNPEQLFFFGSHDDKSPVNWSLAKAFVELTVTPLAQRIAAYNPTVRTINEEGTTTTDVLTGSAAGLVPSPPLRTQPGTKRKRCSSDTLDEPTPALKYPKIRAYSKKEPQAAGYALELLASTCRRWATGVVITDTQVTLHYYDRMGAIFTQPFKFDEEPWRLALFALAIGQCDLVQAGFEPLVAPDTDTTLSQPLCSLKNAILKLPKDSSCKDNAHEGGGEDGIEFVDNLGRGVYSHFLITDYPLYIYGGLTGRGSHVFPGDLVKMIGEATPRDGKGDTNDAGRSGSPANSEGAIVVKLSWPLEKRPCLEAHTINTLVDKIPWMKRHLPQVHCALTIKGKSMGLPRHLFRDMTTAHGLEQRYFTLLFTDCYKHLWDIKTLDDFQAAYVGIVECHHAATRYGRILHQDISENNLLWTWERKHIVGVLNDWDLSTPVAAIGNSTNHRTGTAPFMALDLLGGRPPTHLYRHDLESLFYVLIWAAVHYDIGSNLPYTRVVRPELEKWNGTYEDAFGAKVSFIHEPTSVLRGIQPVWEPLRAKWLKPLCVLFQKARRTADLLASTQDDGQAGSMQEVETPMKLDYSDDEKTEDPAPPHQSTPESPTVNVDFETLGCLTFENFMGALGGWMPRAVPKSIASMQKDFLQRSDLQGRTIAS